METVESLTKQLENILKKLNRIKPIKFYDVECEEAVYDYAGLEETNQNIFIVMNMFSGSTL